MRRLLLGLGLGLGSAIALVSPTLPPLQCGVAQAQSTDSWGQSGRDGQDGRAGQAGRSGSDHTLTVTGTPINLDVSGQDGQNGESGLAATSPWCDRQPRGLARHLQAAHGGDGGDGGQGGNGGNGGSVTLYYNQPSDLRQVSLRTNGGRGGQGGRGARGSYGCSCQQSRWTVSVCTGSNCTEREYTCRDGVDGRHGHDGGDGRDGQWGQITLIPQIEALPAEQPQQQIPLGAFHGAPLTLSRHQWELRSGASTLFAPGSRVADEYRLYTGTIVKNLDLQWAAPQDLSPYRELPITLALTAAGTIEATVNEDLWAEMQIQPRGDRTQVTIANLIRAEEATRLAIADVSGQGQDLLLAVVDLAGRSDLLTTTFTVEYRVGEAEQRRPSRYRTRYEGSLPPHLVTQTANRFQLALGQLPIAPSDLRPGSYVEIVVTATRSLDANTAEQSLTWRGRL